MKNKESYKPTSSQLALATGAVWDAWDTDVALDDNYREINGTELDPGEFCQAELLEMLGALVSVWRPGNYGTYGARTFLANLVKCQVLIVQKANTRGKPSKYSMGIDTSTGQYFTRDAFTTIAWQARYDAYTQAQGSSTNEVQARSDENAAAALDALRGIEL